MNRHEEWGLHPNLATGMGRYDMRGLNKGTSYMHVGRVRFPVSIHVHIESSTDATPFWVSRDLPRGARAGLEQTPTSRLHHVSRLAGQPAW